MVDTGMPATNAVTSDTMMSARNACTFSQMMSTRMRAIAPAAMASRGAVPSVWVQSSKRSPLIQGGAASGKLCVDPHPRVSEGIFTQRSYL